MEKDYKDTLLMPKTNFEMRGNLGVREPLFQKRWQELDLYNKVIEKNKNNKPYLLHDGPPYANGSIHTGHLLNKTLKDFVIRYKNMNGFCARYLPGFDTHGLPIETALAKKGVNRKEKTIPEFRKLCQEYAKAQVELQTEQFKRLGSLGEYDKPYITYNKEFEAEQVKIFAKMVDKGLIFKGLKPVYWSPSSESALAEAEIEYHDKNSESVFVKMILKDTVDTALVIWTTTPWTLPANLAVAVGEDIDYCFIATDLGNLIVAKELLEKLTADLGFKNCKVLKTVKGKTLVGLTYFHPLYDTEHSVLLGHHVTTSDGTGLVHIAPGHGEDDFLIGKNNNLEILCPVNAKGVLTAETKKYQNLFYEEANKVIIEDLKLKNLLLLHKTITHSYPHDWRTKKPVIFRATPQWFASIEKLKKELLTNIAKVKWHPKWGETRITNMIKDREEWCISRQRVWGVPIPVFYGEDQTPILDQEVMLHVADLFKEYGSDIWFIKEAKDLLPKGYKHKSSPNGIFTKETDIMDVWFDSGSSHQMLKLNGLAYPADLYMEGSDQYRGWFNSSLITGVALTGVAPYKKVVSHGFVLDGNGLKISKSVGNTIDVIKEMNTKGADLLRLWVASVEYTSDVRISLDLINQVSENYRKIRNTFKFMLGAIDGFNFQKDNIAYKEMTEVDRYMLIALDELNQAVINAYEDFRFDEILRLINNYISNVLSSFYLDYVKDILYIEAKKSKIRLSVQTVIYEQLFSLLRLLSPIIPHTASEAYWEISDRKEEDIYLCEMPKAKNYQESEGLKAKFEAFFSLRTDVLKALEKARDEKVIGKSLNAFLTIKADKKTYQALSDLDLKRLLIVSECQFLEAKTIDIDVKAFEGKTCARCWNIVKKVDDNQLCPRCVEILNSSNA
ncbi:MAG: isoleucine--tRNA ligase [Erysipelotrichales bacterium]|nr:isoleucine--tRNA ligase [Erysipelotrichales bacterium]